MATSLQLGLCRENLLHLKALFASLEEKRWDGMTLGGLFFFITKDPLKMRKLKYCIEGGFSRVWIISSNSIYVVIILSKLKIYQS